MLRFHKFDEARQPLVNLAQLERRHCGDTVRSECLTNRRSTMSRPGIARGVSGQRCILFQRVLQDCGVDPDHLTAPRGVLAGTKIMVATRRYTRKDRLSINSSSVFTRYSPAGSG